MKQSERVTLYSMRTTRHMRRTWINKSGQDTSFALMQRIWNGMDDISVSALCGSGVINGHE